MPVALVMRGKKETNYHDSHHGGVWFAVVCSVDFLGPSSGPSGGGGGGGGFLGLEAWQWQAYAHLIAVGGLGIISCFITEALLVYILKKPGSLDHGVDYIIRRNLWFQIINTPLVSLMICLYRHFVLSDKVDGNLLSWGNFFETLVIMAFCSFLIGLYWRFKFRGKYLAAELEELKQMNEQLATNAAEIAL